VSRLAPLLAALALGAAGLGVGGCSERPVMNDERPDKAHDWWPRDDCDHAECRTFTTDRGDASVGIQAYDGRGEGDPNARCKVVVRGGPATDESVPYVSTTWVRAGDLIAYGAHTAKIDRCMRSSTVPASYSPAAAALVDHPWYPGLLPAPDHVILVFGGDTVLTDSVAQATARLEPETGGRPEAASVAVQVTQPGTLGELHHGLRAGDAFAWGPYTALIVRVVEPATPVVGWIEVALLLAPPLASASAPEPASAPPPTPPPAPPPAPAPSASTPRPRNPR
jgi:hypothetical protein